MGGAPQAGGLLGGHIPAGTLDLAFHPIPVVGMIVFHIVLPLPHSLPGKFRVVFRVAHRVPLLGMAALMVEVAQANPRVLAVGHHVMVHDDGVVLPGKKAPPVGGHVLDAHLGGGTILQGGLAVFGRLQHLHPLGGGGGGPACHLAHLASPPSGSLV